MKIDKQSLARSELTMRDMRTADLSQVVSIERNAHISPWSRLSFEESLTKQHICRILEVNDEIIAYHVVCPIHDELHILNLVTAPQVRGLGLGHRLMHDVLEIAQVNTSEKILLEVRLSNEVAQNLYSQWNFQQISIRRAYYRSSPQTHDEREDALVFMRPVEKSQ